MPKFNVVLREIEIYEMEEIEAVDESEAIDKAYEMLDENGQKHHTGSDGESEVEWIDED